MSGIIKISDAVVIAIHTIEHLIHTQRYSVSASEMANTLNVSYNHLSKVIQTLRKNGFLKTHRGPAGGYSLTPKGRSAKIKDLLRIFNSGNIYTSCFLSARSCDRKNCVLKDFHEKVILEFNKIAETKISEMKK